MSVYLRDLEFGPWMGIREDEDFSAASLLKIPVLLTVLSLAQNDPHVLGQRILATPELLREFTQQYPPEKSIRAGTAYTVDELLEYMIVYSDNNAKNILDAYLETKGNGEPLLLRTLEELGLYGENRQLDDNITVKQSASLFRVLYNSSFLNKEMSQKALGLLTRSTFTKGIRAGVDGSTVASKFGERETDDGIDQLHDCGIVYSPYGNYLLCIMTRGTSYERQARAIAETSRLVFEEIRNRASKKE